GPAGLATAEEHGPQAATYQPGGHTETADWPAGRPHRAARSSSALAARGGADRGDELQWLRTVPDRNARATDVPDLSSDARRGCHAPRQGQSPAAALAARRRPAFVLLRRRPRRGRRVRELQAVCE